MPWLLRRGPLLTPGCKGGRGVTTMLDDEVRQMCTRGAATPYYFGVPGRPDLTRKAGTIRTLSADSAASSPGSRRHGRKSVMPNRKCECGQVRPTFGLNGESLKDARWCISCPQRHDDAVNLDSRKCECGQGRPRFSAPALGGSSLNPRWCGKCPRKSQNAVDVRAATIKQPLYYATEMAEVKDTHGKRSHLPVSGRSVANTVKDMHRNARWCSICMPEGAVPVSHKLCECRQHRPSHALLGESASEARWCVTCPGKPAKAVDIVSNMCECRRGFPRFGLALSNSDGQGPPTRGHKGVVAQAEMLWEQRQHA